MANTTSWKAAGAPARALTVNGEHFFARGVCYSPVPWGGNPNWTPFGDFFFPPWDAIWERDIAAMRAAGINTIRVYNMQLVIDGVPRDHTPFLDACWNGGQDSIHVLVGCGAVSDLHIYDKPWTNSAPSREAAKQTFAELAQALGTHPAVMGFVVGNEVNNEDTRTNPDFWKYIDELAVAAKAAAPDKLTTIALVDDSMTSPTLGDRYVPNLDVWGINSYRGRSSPPMQCNFDQLWTTYAAQSSKPLLLTEWGAPPSTRDARGDLVFTPQVAADLDLYVAGHYGDTLFNAAETSSDGGSANPNARNWAPVCVGSTYFEWTDEWWKSDGAYPDLPCAATVQNRGLAKNGAYPGGWDDQECYGLNGIEPAGDPARRSLPPGGGCRGPWDFESNTPYPPDRLLPRSSLATLSKLWKAG
jgi:hypothetical protein